MRGVGGAGTHVRRIDELMTFLDRQPQWRDARIVHLQGDASTRSYATLVRGRETVLLMDAPHQPDGPPGPRRQALQPHCPSGRRRHGAPLHGRGRRAAGSRLERTGNAGLRSRQGAAAGRGLRRPGVRPRDCRRRLASRAAAGRGRCADCSTRRAGAASLPLPDGTGYTLPRRDRDAFEIEIELLLDWYWPALYGEPAPQGVRAEFSALWAPVLDRLLALPGGWFLRDYHSPNLFWLPERQGIARVGIIDFQDALDEHFAFDLVSLCRMRV
jgi:aminoglycoside/choline kinase family phosphotransferase